MQARPVAVSVAAGAASLAAAYCLVVTIACSIDLSPNDCESLITSYQQQISSICASGEGGVSSYCNVCVDAGLYSYLPNSSGTSGVCTCWPLIATTTVCSGSNDHEALVSATTAAGRDCSSFQLPDGGGVPFEAAGASGPDSGASSGGRDGDADAGGD